MVRSFQYLLVSLNPTSGRRSWWIVYAIGMTILIGWLVAALPWVDIFTGSMVGIGQYGSGMSNTTMIVYGHEITSHTADLYFLAVLFGIAMVKIGWLFINIGGSFARGYEYEFIPGMGALGYRWHR